MAKFSWNDYCGTNDPFILPMIKIKRGEDKMMAYGLNPGLCKQLPCDQRGMEVFEYGKNHGFYLIVEANSGEQAGYLFRKFLKEAVLTYIGALEEQRPKELDLGVSDKW